MSYLQHPLVELADKHLDATLDRLDKSTQTFWEGQAEYGRSVTKLSSAALILSVSVAQFFILKGAGTTWNLLLPTAWILFGIAIILGAGHHSWLGAANLGRLSIELKRSQIRAAVAALDLDATDLSDRFDAILKDAFKEAETETLEHLKTYKWRSLVLARLTPRQIEVLRMVAERQRTKEIAARLKLSVKTVESHRGEIMKRLEIHDVVGLVRFAMRVRLVGTTG